MPIITAKYAPPSIMACANARLTVESHHVSVGSNSFAAPSPLRDRYSSQQTPLHTARATQNGTHVQMLIGLCKLNTQTHRILRRDGAFSIIIWTKNDFST